MFTALCMKCSKSCKQPITVKLVHCPMFESRIEFDDLMEQLAKFEKDALDLKGRANELLQSALQMGTDQTPEEGLKKAS